MFWIFKTENVNVAVVNFRVEVVAKMTTRSHLEAKAPIMKIQSRSEVMQENGVLDIIQTL